MEKNIHNGMQKPEENISGPDFICDPVPHEDRKFYERRKGRHHVAAGIFAAAVVFGGVIQTDGTLWMWGDNGKQRCGVNARVAGSFAEPVQVREGVRMVWPDRLSFRGDLCMRGRAGR